jgi:hypothetical protein
MRNIKKKFKADRNLWIIWGILIVGVLFWFFTAPAVNFGYGFTVMLFLMQVLMIIQGIQSWLPRFTKLNLQLVFIFLTALFLFGESYSYLITEAVYIKQNIRHQVVMQEEYKKPDFDTIDLNNFEVNVPVEKDGPFDGSLYYTPLPSTPYRNAKVEARDPEDLKAGFRHKE